MGKWNRTRKVSETEKGKVGQEKRKGWIKEVF
jgi:hypothetical protein